MAPKPSLLSNISDKKFQALVTQPMSLAQQKAFVAELSKPQNIDSLKRPEILMDFFTDCVSSSDLSLSVPAISGLFHLITKRNLDYPSFYPRLYALLDSNVLHSKYRSRVLRHLDVFLSPTNHLPATTVASFVKRLSRLCLFAPPSAIVAIVPFIYNLLKSYPPTTFLIHRNPFPPYTKSENNLGSDPFDPSEQDPQFTGAVESSLWELDTLRSHYHPTVAGICKIISEQFTKQQYNLEDFLDHGYGTLMEAELGREGKKVPVVEYKIPKHIFTKAHDRGVGADSEEGSILTQLWSSE